MAVAVNQYPLAAHAWRHCLAAVHHACIRHVIIDDFLILLRKNTTWFNLLYVIFLHQYLLQARVPSQRLLYAPCSQSCTARLEPARIAAKGQRHQEGVCLSLEAVLTQAGS